MGRFLLLFPALVIAVAGLAACGGKDPYPWEQDVPEADGAADPGGLPDAPPADVPPVASLRVIVQGGADTRVIGAIVQAGGQRTATDDTGEALFPDLPEGRLVVRVDAPGYAPSTAVIDSRLGVAGRVVVRVLALGAPLRFQASEGALLMRGNVRLQIPAGGVVDAAGKPFNGEVQLTIAQVDPTAGALLWAPGPFRGVRSAGGDAVLLDSAYMADVTMWNGEERLQLAEGVRATVSFMLPWNIQQRVKAGDRIPLWWYDLDAGLWREEGDGVVTALEGEGSSLAWVAEIGHFSWINCDDPVTDISCVVVRVRDGQPSQRLGGVQVMVYPPSERGTPETWAGYSSGTTDGGGEVCLLFPRGQEVSAGLVDPGFGLFQSLGTVPAGQDWGVCEGTNERCTELEFWLTCGEDADCQDDDPCVFSGCEDGQCRRVMAPWVGTPCGLAEEPDSLAHGVQPPGQWMCDQRRCPSKIRCEEDDLRTCRPDGLLLTSPTDTAAYGDSDSVRVSGMPGCLGANVTISLTSPGGVRRIVDELRGLDGPFDRLVPLAYEGTPPDPGLWTLTVKESGSLTGSGYLNCVHEVVRTLRVVDLLGFGTGSEQKPGVEDRWFQVAWANVPVGCLGGLRVVGSDQQQSPRGLAGVAAEGLAVGFALTNAGPFQAGQGPATYAKARSGWESAAGNGTLPRACLALDAASGVARIVQSLGRDPVSGAGLFPDDSDVACAGPQLLRDRQIVVDQQLAAEGLDAVALHADLPWPRSAVCVTAAGEALLLMARASSGSMGLDTGFTLKELADYLVGRNCVDAMLLESGPEVFLDAAYPLYQTPVIPSLYHVLAGYDCSVLPVCQCPDGTP